jgi:hypothetical protein
MRRRAMIERMAAAGLAMALLGGTPSIAADRTAIGVFRDWGAFREGPATAPTRCFAIAEPPRGTAAAGRGAFASVASWPAKRIRAQLAIRLSHPPRGTVTLSIANASFVLVSQGQDAWAHDRHADAAIVATMRSGSSMSISGVTADGVPFADAYRLRGAASAIDAASLACPPAR